MKPETANWIAAILIAIAVISIAHYGLKASMLTHETLSQIEERK